MKKILSLLLSVAMICTMFTLTLSVSAADVNTVNVSTVDELDTVIRNAGETPTVINVTKKLEFESDTKSILIDQGQNITINLNSNTVECTFWCRTKACSLTINGPGTIKSYDGSGIAGIILEAGSTLVAKDVKILGSNVVSDGEGGGYGIHIVDGTVRLDNCYVASGNSKGNKYGPSAISSNLSTNEIYIKDSTFVNGTGSQIPLDTIYECKILDFDGTELTDIDRAASPLIIGKGFAYEVDGDTIKDTNGYPARGNSPVSATVTVPAPTYTVTIPETVNFGEQKQALAKYKDSDKDQYGEPINVSKTFTITATNVDNLFDDLGKKPQIDVAVTFDGLLKDSGTATIPYTVKSGDNAFTSGNVFCSFTNSSQVSVSLLGVQKAEGTVWINRTDITKTANYTGTMTFTISIPDQA